MKKTDNADLGRISVEEFKHEKKLPVVIILDNIRSMLNVGSVFRTADAFIIEKVFLTGITAKPPHREIHKTALGATKTVEWEYMEHTMEVVRELKKDGYVIVAVEQATPHISLEKFEVKDNRYALVFGNEVFGVSDDVIQASNFCLEIPQLGTKHSLNISVSVGIVLWKMFNELKLSKMKNNS